MACTKQTPRNPNLERSTTPMGRPGGSQYWQKRKQTRKLETTTSYTSLETE